MTSIAVTGHRDLTPRTVRLVDAAVRAALEPYAPDLDGVSCLAAGADQIFARAVLDLGGRLHAVVPARRYRGSLPATARRTFDSLLASACTVRRLKYEDPTGEAYVAANEVLLAGAHRLVAVWDHRPPEGPGGTAEAVAEARRRGIAVEVIWPVGARRVARTVARVRRAPDPLAVSR
jgi:hypothetical protein